MRDPDKQWRIFPWPMTTRIMRERWRIIRWPALTYLMTIAFLLLIALVLWEQR